MKGTPPWGTPFRHPHSEQRRPARAHAVGLVLGPITRTDRTRDTQVAEPWLPAPEDGRPGEGQTPLTTVAGHPPPGTATHQHRGTTVEGTPPGTPFRHPHNPKPSRGELGPDRPPPSTPDGARDRGRTRRGARTTWNGPTSAQCRDRTRCARHTTQGGGADTAGVRVHTHAKGTRGLPEGQPDRARRTHRPRGMAYQRVRVRDTRTGQPATRSAGHAGREGGNGRDTTPGTGPNPPNRPRAPRTHRWGTAPAQKVVSHCATPQPLG